MGYKKYTMFFDYRSNTSGVHDGGRSAGWSESVYHNELDDSKNSVFAALLEARLGLLPKSSAIIGYRITDTDKKSGGLIRNHRLPGKWDETVDIPTLALLCNGMGANGERLRVILRGMPDIVAEEGEYSNKAGIWPRFTKYRDALRQFFTLTRDPNSNQAKVLSIDVEGHVHTAANVQNIAKGDKVHLLRPVFTMKRKIKGVYTVTAVTNESTFEIGGWDGGFCTAGVIRRTMPRVTHYPANLTIARVITRKVGRPYFSYAGRH